MPREFFDDFVRVAQEVSLPPETFGPHNADGRRIAVTCSRSNGRRSLRGSLAHPGSLSYDMAAAPLHSSGHGILILNMRGSPSEAVCTTGCVLQEETVLRLSVPLAVCCRRGSTFRCSTSVSRPSARTTERCGVM
eukprot:1175454-Prorocentrum_minimum.AAC.4